jgi:phage baseplate assembly protein V
MDIRVGLVSAVDINLARARVTFPDLDSDDSTGLLSAWLPVCQHGSFGNFGYWLPSVDEQVVCIFHAKSAEDGFIIGGIYSQADVPPTTGSGVWYQQFADGTVIAYNPISGIAIVTPLNVHVQGAAVLIDGPTTITGDVTVNGNVVVSDDLTASGIDMVTHVHAGVQAGGSNTAGPH